MSTTTTAPLDCDWIEAISLEEFRGIVQRYDNRRTRRLRDALIGKAGIILGQLREDPAAKHTRDGHPMSRPQYDRWREGAEGALGFTEQQIQICNSIMWGQSMPPNQVLRILLDLAEDTDHPTPDEIAAMKIVRHHLNGANDGRSNS